MDDGAAPREEDSPPSESDANPLSPAPAEAIAFLEHLSPGGPWRLTYICPGERPVWWPNRKKDGKPCGTITRIAHTHADVEQFVLDGARDRLNCYYTPNRSKVQAARKLKKHEITQLAFLHVDSDPRAIDPTTHTPEQCAAHYADQTERLMVEARAFEPAPTVVVHSGGGLNILWRAAEPLALNCTKEDKSEAVEAERWSRHLQSRFIGGDETHNVDRILRLPGTINWPDEKKRKRGRVPTLARVAFANWGATVDLGQMPKAPPLGAAVTVSVQLNTNRVTRTISQQQIQELPVSDRVKAAIVSGPDPSEPLDGGDQTRSAWVFYVLGALDRAGVDDQTMFDIITDGDLGISAHVRDEGRKTGRLEEYALRQIQRAKEDNAKRVVAPGSVPMSDDHLADTLAHQHAVELRYCDELGTWFKWDGARWVRESTLLAYDLARRIAKAAAKREADRERLSLAKSLASAKTVNAIVQLARSDRRLAIEAATFDADPMILNTPGGILDLRSGQLAPPDPLRYCTRVTRVAPETGEPELWLRFLHDITLGDAEYIAYLQRVAGYLLTGLTIEHAMFFLYGAGENGKSTFVNTLQHILDDYARTIAFATLAATPNQQHSTDLAGLRGARLAVCSETEQGERWAEAKIKSMTGGDVITARFMRQDFFDYVPQFKLVVVGNHKPGIVNVDKAMRRRMHLLPFTAKIAQADLRLPERLRAEAGRILGWCVQGLLAWQRDGLAPPPIVAGATSDYLGDQDTLGQWLADCTEACRDSARIGDLFESFDDWCRAANEPRRSKRWLCDRLEDRGFERGVGSGNMKIVRGLRLTNVEAGRLHERRQARLDEASERGAVLSALGRRARAQGVETGEEPPF